MTTGVIPQDAICAENFNLLLVSRCTTPSGYPNGKALLHITQFLTSIPDLFSCSDKLKCPSHRSYTQSRLSPELQGRGRRLCQTRSCPVRILLSAWGRLLSLVKPTEAMFRKRAT